MKKQCKIIEMKTALYKPFLYGLVFSNVSGPVSSSHLPFLLV